MATYNVFASVVSCLPRVIRVTLAALPLVMAATATSHAARGEESGVVTLSGGVFTATSHFQTLSQGDITLGLRWDDTLTQEIGVGVRTTPLKGVDAFIVPLYCGARYVWGTGRVTPVFTLQLGPAFGYISADNASGYVWLAAAKASSGVVVGISSRVSIGLTGSYEIMNGFDAWSPIQLLGTQAVIQIGL